MKKTISRGEMLTDTKIAQTGSQSNIIDFFGNTIGGAATRVIGTAAQAAELAANNRIASFLNQEFGASPTGGQVDPLGGVSGVNTQPRLGFDDAPQTVNQDGNTGLALAALGGVAAALLI